MKGLKKADIPIILIFLAAAAVLFGLGHFTEKNGARAEVYVDGKYSTSLPLDKDTVYIPEGKKVRIEVKDGKAAFVESDCPDKICIHTGFIGKGGQTAVCLPNAVSVVIRSGDDGNDVDAVS